MPKEFETQVETYDIDAELGRDDLTIAYSARRKSDDLPVVIRVVAPQFAFDPFFIRRFKDAMLRSMKLAHPNIVKVYEVAEKDDIVYVAREWVEADSLAEYLKKEGPLPITRVVDLVAQLASALDYAHVQGIKHGDLSDTSLFMADDHVWITDFGLLMAMDGTSLVKKGFGVGNPVYLSPERVKGEGSSRIADLYALGTLCYQMLTGQPPFSGEASAVLHAQIYDQPRPPHELNRKVTRAVSDVVLRILSKGLELRYNTGAEFVAALRAAAEGTAPMRRPKGVRDASQPLPSYPRPPLSRRFALWLFVITPLIGLALAVGFWATSRFLGDRQVVRSTQLATPADVDQQGDLLPADLTPVPRLTQDEAESPDNVLPATTDEISPNSEETFPTNTPLPGTATPAPSPTPSPTATPVATTTPVPLPVGPVVAGNSPFTNLILAQAISDDFQPVGETNIFQPTREPVYLFFDYNTIETGTSWRQVWKWDDVIMQQSEDLWPDEYGTVGTAWIYFSPANGFNPGPYSITLEVEGEVVASIDFIVQE